MYVFKRVSSTYRAFIRDKYEEIAEKHKQVYVVDDDIRLLHNAKTACQWRKDYTISYQGKSIGLFTLCTPSAHPDNLLLRYATPHILIHNTAYYRRGIATRIYQDLLNRGFVLVCTGGHSERAHELWMKLAAKGSLKYDDVGMYLAKNASLVNTAIAQKRLFEKKMFLAEEIRLNKLKLRCITLHQRRNSHA